MLCLFFISLQIFPNSFFNNKKSVVDIGVHTIIRTDFDGTTGVRGRGWQYRVGVDMRAKPINNYGRPYNIYLNNFFLITIKMYKGMDIYIKIKCYNKNVN